MLLVNLFFGTWAQNSFNKRDPSFQVIFAENVEDKEGKRINSRDMIYVDDILTITKNGFLAMMNYDGFPVEIEGDTTIHIAHFHKTFDLMRNPQQSSSSIFERMDIDYLFITDRELAREKRTAMTGACSLKCDFDMEVYDPPNAFNRFFFAGDLCLKWHPTRSNNYVVELRTMFDDLVEKYACTTNELRIDSADLAAMFNGEEALLLVIKDKTGAKQSTANVIKKFPSDAVSYPYKCGDQKATYALVTAFRLEIGPRDYPKAAEYYYRLAAESSSKEFFRAMLENYNKRKQNY